MRTLTLFVISFFFVGSVHGQTRILKDINFNKGNWRLVGIALGEKPNSLEDSVGDFIITDKHDLKEIKKRWKFKEVGYGHTGGNYKLLFVNDKNHEIRYDLDLEKNYLAKYEEGASVYEFTLQLFYASFKHLKRISRTTFIADSLETAKKLRGKLLLMDTVYFFNDNYFFAEHDGSMLIQLTETKPGYGAFAIEEDIQTSYPNEKFEVTNKGENTYRIDCNKSLGKAIKLFPIKDEWQPYSSIGFYIYGLNEEQLNKIIQSIK